MNHYQLQTLSWCGRCLLAGWLLCMDVATGPLAAQPALPIPAVSGPKTSDEPQYRQVYIPLEEIDVLFSNTPGVVLKRDEFLKLWNAAHPTGAATNGDLQPAAIVGGDYVARIVDHALELRGTVKIHKPTAEPERLTLPLQGLAVASARLGDAAAPLGLDAQGRLAVFLTKKGEQTLTWTLTAPLALGKEAFLAQFKLPPAPGALQVIVPPKYEVRLAGVRAPVVATAKEPTFQIGLGGIDNIELLIHRQSEVGGRQPLLVASLVTHLRLTPSQADWKVVAQVEAHAQPVAVLKFNLPAGLQVVGVDSPGLSRWKTTDVQGGSELELTFQSDWTGTRQVQIHALGAPTLNEAWTLPRIVLAGAAVQAGRLEVEHDNALGVELRGVQGAQRLAPENVSDTRLRVAYWRDDYQTQILVRPRVQQIAASVVTLLNIGRNRVELTSNLTVEPRFAPLFELTVSLPTTWSILGVTVNGQPATYQPTTAGERQRLRITLPEPVASGNTIDLEVRADQAPKDWLGEPDRSATLPLTSVTVEGVAEVEGLLWLRSPDEIQLSVSDLQNFESIPISSVPGADEKVRLALRYRSTQIGGKLQAARRPPQVVVQTDISVHRTKSYLSALYSAHFELRGGTSDELTFELPNVAANQVQIQVPDGNYFIVSQQIEDLPADRRRWRLQFERDLTDPITLHILLELPAEEQAEVKLPTLSVDGALRQSGTIAVEGSAEQELLVDAKFLRVIDPSELPALTHRLPAGRLVASFQYRGLPYELKLGVKQHPDVSVLNAYCPLATLQSVIDESGVIRHRIQYQIVNAGKQQLYIQLPEGAEPLSASLMNEPVELRRSGTKFVVPLPSALDQAKVDFELHYRTAVPPLLELSLLKQQPPKLDVPVLKLDWQVFVPVQNVVVKSDGNIRPLNPLQRDSVIGSIRDALLEREGHRFFNPFELFMMRSETAVFSRVGASAPKTAAPGGAEEVFFGNYQQQVNGTPKPSLPPAVYAVDEAAPQAEAPADEPFALKEMSDQQKAIIVLPQAEPQGNPEEDLLPAETAPGARPGRASRYATANGSRNAGQPGDKDGGKDRFDDLRQEAGEQAALAQAGVFPTGEGAANRGPRPLARRGLLSLQMTLEPLGREYHFVSLGGDGELVLQLQQERFCNGLVAVVAVAIMLVGWYFREANRVARALAIALLIAIAVGLSGVVPLSMIFWLDGLFLGAIGLWLLYIARAICGSVASGFTWLGTQLDKGLPAAKAGAVLLLCGLCLTVAQTVAVAQPTAVPAKPAAGVPVAVTPGAKLPTIYVPYANSEDPLQSNRVFLPREEYKQLWDLAHPADRKLPDPAERGLTGEATLRGTLEGNTAHFTAEVKLWSFRDDWVSFRVPLARVVFSQVLLDGQPAVLTEPTATPVPALPAQAIPAQAAKPAAAPVPPADAPLFPQVYVRGRGEHKLELTFDVPVTRTGAMGELVLQLAAVGSGNLELKLPDPELEVQVTGLPGGWKWQAGTLTAALGNNGPVTIRWQPPSARRLAEFLASLHQTTRLEAGRSGLRMQSRLEYLIRQGSAERLEIQLPEPILVRNVTGDQIADWSLEGAGAERKLVLRSGKPLSGSVQVDLDLFLPYAEKTDLQAFPEVRPLGLGRETGEIVLVAHPALQVAIRDATGLQQISRPEKTGPFNDPATQAWPVLAAYRYATRPIALSLQVQGRQGRLNSHVITAVQVSPERVQLVSAVTLQPSELPLIAARLKLPAGFTVDTVETPPHLRWDTVGEGTAPILEVEQANDAPTLQSLQPVTIRLSGWVSRDPKATTVAVPAIEVLESAQQRGQWAVFVQPGLDAETAGLSGLLPVDPSQVVGALSVLPLTDAFAHCSPQLTFQQQAWPATLSVRLQTLTPRLQANAVTVVSVGEVDLAFASRLTWKIEQAGVRQLVFVAPDWLGQDLDLKGTGIRQVESTAIDGGRRRFVVGLDREVLGPYLLQINQVMPIPDDLIIQAPRIVPQADEPPNQFVVLENASPDQLDRLDDAALKVESLETNDPRLDLADLPRNRAIEAVRLLSSEGRLAWQLRSAQKIEALKASVNLAELIMVADLEGNYRAQLKYRVSNRQEQFLAVRFPPETQIWSVHVADQPSKPALGKRQGFDVMLFPLSKTAAGDFASNVDIIYTGKLTRQADWLGSWRWSFPSPEVLDLPVAETQFTLFLPKNLDFGSFQGNMEEAEIGVLEYVRQSAEFREAFQLLNEVSSGKGSAKTRAVDNLIQFGNSKLQKYNDQSVEPVKTERGRQLREQNRSQRQQLEKAIQELQQKPSDGTEADRGKLNLYFNAREAPAQPVAPPMKKPQAYSQPQPNAPVEQSVRSRLQENLKSKAEVLNANQQSQEEQTQSRGDVQQYGGQAGGQYGGRDGQVFFGRSGLMPGEQPNMPLPNDSYGMGMGGSGGGLGGGGGGGLGMGGFGGPMPNQGQMTMAQGDALRAGGLSLPIELPQEGTKLYFYKARGNPQLSIAITPIDHTSWLAGLAWLSICGAIAVALGWLAAQPAFLNRLVGQWPWAVMLLGLVWWIALPLSAVGFLVFALGCFCLFWRWSMQRLLLSLKS